MVQDPNIRDIPEVPGSVVTYSPAKSGLFIGSPGLAVLPNGWLAAKCDLFGPASTEEQSGLTRVFVSWDAGSNWHHSADIADMYWASLFTHGDALYLLGTACEYGSIVIARSEDFGSSWTAPRVLRAGSYHCAPVPIVEHRGRLWRAFEHRRPASGWAGNFRALLISAPLDDDLLAPESWTASESLSRNPEWNNGDFHGWLEGNVVVTGSGEVLNVLRVHVEGPDDKAAIVRFDESGVTPQFDPATDLIDFPGGATKFTIRFDPETQLYWSLVNAIPPRYRQPNPTKVRNTLALACSSDLRDWTIASVALFHPDQTKHGIQYVDWLFDDDDIVFLSRTAWLDQEGGARNQHDANFLTYHRLPQFRTRTLSDAPLNDATRSGIDIFAPQGVRYQLLL